MKYALHLRLLLLALGGLTLSACKDSQEQAHSALATRNYDFSVDEFHRAIRSGNLEIVRQFLDAGMDVDAADSSGNTALLLAAENGHGHLVHELLDRKANPNHARTNGDTPLMVAARSGDTQTISLLLDAQADASAKNQRNLTALAEAALAGQSTAASLLARKSGGSLDYALQLAAVKGKTDVIEVLLNKGADVLSRSSENRTPLMYAALYGREDAVRLLTERGSNRLAIDNAQKTAAMLAEENGHDSIAVFLNDAEAVSASADSAADPPPQAQPVGALGTVVRTASHPDGEPFVPTEFAAPASKNPSPPSLPQKLADSHWPAASGQETPQIRDMFRFHAYRERQLPILLEDVAADEKDATLRLLQGEAGIVTVRPGEMIPGTQLRLISAKRRQIHSKGGKGQLVNVSTVLLKDLESGESSLALRGRPVTSGKTYGLLSSADGQLYEVRTGDTFQIGEDAYLVTDVRPAQIVLENKQTQETTVISR